MLESYSKMMRLKLSEVFGNNIFTRRTISNFFEELNKKRDKEMELDFSDIDFISRSCVDEYIKQKEKTTKKLVELNLSKDVCSMFNVVKIQYKKAGVPISFDICNVKNKGFIPA